MTLSKVHLIWHKSGLTFADESESPTSSSNFANFAVIGNSAGKLLSTAFRNSIDPSKASERQSMASFPESASKAADRIFGNSPKWPHDGTRERSNLSSMAVERNSVRIIFTWSVFCCEVQKKGSFKTCLAVGRWAGSLWSKWRISSFARTFSFSKLRQYRGANKFCKKC